MFSYKYFRVKKNMSLEKYANQWINIHEKSFSILYSILTSKKLNCSRILLHVSSSIFFREVLNILSFLDIKKPLFYCFFIKKFIVCYFLEMDLRLNEKIFFVKYFGVYFIKESFYKSAFDFSEKINMLVGCIENVLGYTNSNCIERLYFLKLSQIKKLILKNSTIILSTIFYSYFNSTADRFKKSGEKNFVKNIRKIIKNIVSSEGTMNNYYSLIYQLTKINTYFIDNKFKDILLQNFILYNKVLNIDGYDLFFAFKIKIYFQFNCINLNLIRKTPLLREIWFIEFLSNFFLHIKLKNESYFKFECITKNLLKIINYVNTKNIKFFFGLEKKRNYDMLITIIKFSIKNICKIRLNSNITNDYINFLYHSNIKSSRNIDNKKWKAIEIIKFNYYFRKKKKFFFFLFILGVFWKNKKKILPKNLHKTFFYEYLFEIREFFLFFYSLIFFSFVKIISLSMIFKKGQFKKNIISCFYSILDILLTNKIDKKHRYIEKMLIIKDIVQLLMGKNIFNQLKNAYTLDRLIVFLYKFTQKNKISKTVNGTFFRLLEMYFDKKNKFVNTEDKCGRDFLNFLYSIVSQPISGFNFDLNIYSESKKDVLSFVNLSINLTLFDPKIFEKLIKKKTYLPISVYRSLRLVSRVYFFHRKKTEEIIWNFNLSKFLIESVGFLCSRRKFIFFHTSLVQMLVLMTFNRSPVVIKKDLKLLLTNNSPKLSLKKKKTLKLQIQDLIIGKKCKNLDFLVLNRQFYPKSTIKKLAIISYNFQIKKDTLFLNLVNLLERDCIYTCQALIVKIVKNIIKITCCKLLIKIRRNLSEFFISDPRGLKNQIEELCIKNYIQISKRKKFCKYMLI
nr:ubiquitin-protein ligase (Cullin) isoform 1 [Cryptomonas sp.]